jgi:hypothetical protein
MTPVLSKGGAEVIVNRCVCRQKIDLGRQNTLT